MLLFEDLQTIFANFYRSRCPHRSLLNLQNSSEISSKSFAHEFKQFLKFHGPTSIKDINVRIGEEKSYKSIQRTLKTLAVSNLVVSDGATNNVRYRLT